MKTERCYIDVKLEHPTENMTLNVSLSREDYEKWAPYLIKLEAILLAAKYRANSSEYSVSG